MIVRRILLVLQLGNSRFGRLRNPIVPRLVLLLGDTLQLWQHIIPYLFGLLSPRIEEVSQVHVQGYFAPAGGGLGEFAGYPGVSQGKG